jgi:Flp pilus assembly pilin Flp
MFAHGLTVISQLPYPRNAFNIECRKATNMRSLLRRLWREEDGQDMIEYALLAATLAVVVAGVFPQSLMPSVSTIFSKITSSFAVS